MKFIFLVLVRLILEGKPDLINRRLSPFVTLANEIQTLQANPLFAQWLTRRLKFSVMLTLSYFQSIVLKIRIR